MKLKKLLSALLVCVMVLGCMSVVAFADENTVSIGNAAELLEFVEQSQKDSFSGKTVVLTNDIDLSDVKEWKPICAPEVMFAGTFDGQGHTIRNLKFSNYSIRYGGGFFRQISGATVKNVTFDNAYIFTPNCNITAVVSGYSYGNSTFENVYVKNSSVYGFGKVGGIIGMAADPGKTTTVKNCSVEDSKISAYYDASGVIGLGQGKIVMSGNAVENVTFKALDSDNNYKELDTEVTCDGSVASCAGTGTKIGGKYWINDGYYWGGYADFYIHYGNGSHDCSIKGESLKVANSEVLNNAVAEINGVKYLTLSDAVAAAKDGDTVNMLCDASGDGIVIPSGSDLTIDFGGHTYTLNNPLVGSSEDTKTNGFQLLKDSDIVFRNGSLYSEKANILIQNYSNLTLEDMNLSLNRLHENPKQPLYTLSNNNGNTVLKGNTNISALERNFALDVCRFSSYPGVTVTLDESMTGTIDGKIEISNSKGTTVDNDNFNLIIKNGTVNGEIVDSRTDDQKAAYPKIGKISGGNFSTDVKRYADEGFTTKLVDGRYNVVKAEAKVVDTAKTNSAEVKLDELDMHDEIDLNEAATYKVVVQTAPTDDIKAANDKIKAAADENSEKQIFDISVIKTDSEGSEKDISGTITNQKVTVTLSETPLNGVRVYHVNGTAAEEITPVTVNGNEVSFTAPSFSTYAFTYNTGAVDESTITNKVGVVFSPVTEGGNEYYITLKALETGKKINRFMAADIAFKNDSADVTYEIAPAANINVNETSANKYHFEMNGSSASSVSGDSITIGTVKFGGYGSTVFGIDEAATADYAINIVNTAKSADNIIDHYDLAGGTLVVNDAANKSDYPVIADDETGKIDTTIKAETAALTVNVKFNNPVGNQIATYQNMKVTVSGGDLAAEKEFAIGSDENEVVNGQATVICDELTKGVAYTVTVTGAGYRTARHTVTMSGDKTLTFWNNVLDTAKAVEEGKTAVTKNFLAGDIVKDSKINIYDLSAVVSYYGRTNDTATADVYAKYDLNRDGVIDSKDVSMVLVSWGE